jgi:hypothetical protein
MEMGTRHHTPLVTALEQLAPHEHLCSIYESSEEHFAVAIPFIRIGLDRGEKCIYIADDGTEAIVRDAMHAAGIDVDRGRSIRSGRERYAESNAWWHATGKKRAPEEWASARALVNGETSVNEVLDIETFDGFRKIIQNSAVPIRDTHGRITGAVVVNEDISARTAAERSLKDSCNQLRTLTGRLMRAQDAERRAHRAAWRAPREHFG